MVQRGKGDEYGCLVRRLALVPSQPVGVTIVSFEEQMRGWLAFVARARTTDRVVLGYGKLRALIEDFQTRPVVDFDAAALGRFEELVAARVRIGTMDLRIASIALARNALLLSRNLRDFQKVPGLRVEDWTRE